MKKLSKKLLSVLLVFAMLIPTGAMTVTTGAVEESIKIGDYITLGEYYGEPIVWRCVDIDENGPLMLSDKILCLKAFDANGENVTYHNDGWGYIRKEHGSNCWADSSIRQWLNTSGRVEYTHCPPTSERVSGGYNAYAAESGFLTNFSDQEKLMIKTVTQKNYLNSWDAQKRTGYLSGGTRELNYSISLTKVDYTSYYYQNVTDSIFLLNPNQADAVAINFGKDYLINAYPTQAAVSYSDYNSENLTTSKPWVYFSAIPRNEGESYENMTLFGSSGEVSINSCDGKVGIRPAFYLNVDAWDSEGDMPGEHFPAGYDFYEDSFDFENYSDAYLEYKYFSAIYESAAAKTLHSKHHGVAAGGLCFGMAYATAAIYNGLPSCEKILKWTGGYCNNIRDISKMSVFNVGTNTISISDYIKYAFVYQCGSEVAESSVRTYNDINGLKQIARKYAAQNAIGVTVSMKKLDGSGGHRVVIVGMDGSDLLIDDPNNPDGLEKLMFNSNGSWVFSGYGNYNSKNSIIVYQTDFYRPYQILLTGNKAEAKSIEEDKSDSSSINTEKIDQENMLVVVDSDNYSINNSDFVEVAPFDAATNSEMGNATEKMYWIKNTDTAEISVTEGAGTITVAGDDSILTATVSEESTVSMTINESDINASVKTNTGEEAELTFETVDEEGNVTGITVSGTANGDEVVASETEDGIQVTGLNDITVTYETPDGTAETKADVTDGSTVNITVNDDENKVETDWQDKEETETDEECKHSDANHDGICDACSEDFTKGCSCNCHGNAFMQFLHKIVSFLRKLFGMTQYQYCNCGKAHW